MTLGSLFDGIAGFPLECERLQGFPDGWTTVTTDGAEISDSARYKALGNSIAIPCAARVFEGIKEAANESRIMERLPQLPLAAADENFSVS